jgi:hypothetical protein
MAAEVERATRPLLLRLFGLRPEPLPARVERVDGSIVELKLTEVVLDGGSLVGRDAAREVVVIGLPEVKRVWRRRLHTRRTAAVCAATMAAGSAASVVWSSAPFGDAILLGAVLGMPVAALISVVLNQFKVLSEWVLLYDRDA